MKESFYSKSLENLTFTDDYMFGEVLKDPELCAGLIERLLKIKVDHIEYPELQKSIKPTYESHGVRFDVYVKDSDKVYDIEMQNKDYSEILLRSRYYQSMIDADNLLKGHIYKDLPESFVIFICKNDPFNLGLPCYTFKTSCQETAINDKTDKTIKLFYNASAWDKSEDEELKSFFKFVCSNKAESSFTKTLSQRVRETINNEEFISRFMAVNLHDYDIMEESRNEGLAQGRAEGRVAGMAEGAREAKIQTAKNMLKMKLGSIEQIAQVSGLSIKEVEELAGK